MRDYGKVFSQFWASDDVRSMSEDARTLALYLMTCQHGTTSGVFPLPDGYVCEDIGWDSERVSKGFEELFRKGFSTRCGNTKWVWVRKHLDWNPPENPNQWKSAKKFAERVPLKCVWRNEFLAEFSRYQSGEMAGIHEPLPKGSETLSKPESETEAKTEGRRQKASAKPPKVRIPADFHLTADLTDYASRQLPDCDPGQLFAQFTGQARSKGWEYVDWDAAFQTYCRNAKRDSGHFSAGNYPRKGSNGIHADVVMR